MFENTPSEKPNSKIIAENVFGGMLRNTLEDTGGRLTEADLEQCIDKTLRTLETQGEVDSSEELSDLHEHLKNYVKTMNFFNKAA